MDVVDHEFIVVGLKHSFGHGRLHRLVGALRTVDGDLADTRAEGASGGEHRCTDHAVASGNEQRRAEIGLAAERVALPQQALYLRRLDQMEAGLDLVGGFAAQADVEHLPAADQLGFFRDEEADVGELDGEREVGLDDVAGRSLTVPVGEHAAGHVDGYHRGTRFVDVAHQGAETAVERLAQTRAEEAVDDQIIGAQLGSVERVDNLDEIGFGKVAAHHVAEMDTLVLDAVAAYVEEVDHGSEAALHEAHGRGQSVGAVVSGACENDRAFCGTPVCGNLGGGGFGHTFHERSRRYGFCRKSLALDGADIIGGKKLHDYVGCF